MGEVGGEVTQAWAEISFPWKNDKREDQIEGLTWGLLLCILHTGDSL